MTRLLILTAFLAAAALAHAQPVLASTSSDAECQLIASYQAPLQDDSARQHVPLTDLTERFPDDPAANWLRRANAQADRGDSAGAAASARRGIAIDPSYAPLYHTLANAEMALGNLLEADGAFRRHIRLAPDEPSAHDAYREFRAWAVGLIDC